MKAGRPKERLRARWVVWNVHSDRQKFFYWLDRRGALCRIDGRFPVHHVEQDGKSMLLQPQVDEADFSVKKSDPAAPPIPEQPIIVFDEDFTNWFSEHQSDFFFADDQSGDADAPQTRDAIVNFPS
jgi:hypothetical protein